MFDFGGSPAISHSVKCWFCDERPAVYVAGMGKWYFMPCWECQKPIMGVWSRKKKWYEFWK